MKEIYLDNNATTRPTPSVRLAVLKALDDVRGNASSVHSAGDSARELLRHARASVAALIGAEADQVFFTSGGTESNNMVLNVALSESIVGALRGAKI